MDNDTVKYNRNGKRVPASPISMIESNGKNMNHNNRNMSNASPSSRSPNSNGRIGPI